LVLREDRILDTYDGFAMFLFKGCQLGYHNLFSSLIE
jgi:hypothetical protein